MVLLIYIISKLFLLNVTQTTHKYVNTVYTLSRYNYFKKNINNQIKYQPIL